MYMDNISVPFVLMNAEDDPIIPEHLHDIAKKYAGIISFSGITNVDCQISPCDVF